MAITSEELHSIINDVLSSLRTNSKTIEQLTRANSLADDDLFEIGNGKSVKASVIKEYVKNFLISQEVDMSEDRAPSNKAVQQCISGGIKGAITSEITDDEDKAPCDKAVKVAVHKIKDDAIGLNEPLSITPGSTNRFIFDFYIPKGAEFDIVADVGTGKTVAFDVMYVTSTKWENLSSLKDKQGNTLAVDKAIQKIRISVDSSAISANYAGYVRITYGIRREVDTLSTIVHSLDDNVCELQKNAEACRAKLSTLKVVSPQYTNNSETNSLIRELYISNPEEVVTYRIKHILLRNSGSFLVVEDDRESKGSFKETLIALGAKKETFNNKVKELKIGDATIYVVLNLDHEDFSESDHNHSNLAAVFGESAYNSECSPIITEHLNAKKLETLKSLSDDIDIAKDGITEVNNAVKDVRKDITDIMDDVSDVKTAITGIAPQQDVVWGYGYYKEDGSIAGASPTSQWRCTDIRVTKTSGTKVTSKLTNNIVTFCMITDAEGSMLWAKSSYAGGEIDLSNYPSAKHVLLTTNISQVDYFANIEYDNNGGVLEDIETIKQDILGLKKEVSSSSNLVDYPLVNEMNVLVIGDSISTGDNPFGFPNYGNYDKWVDILKEWGFFGEDVINNSLHASGFVAENPNTKLSIDSVSYKNTFLDRTKYLVDKGLIDLSTFDLVIVFGGINDFKDISLEMGTAGSSDTSKIIPAMQEFYDYLFENAVQARICTILPSRISMGDTMRGVTIWEFADAIKDVIKKYSIPYLDLTTQSGFAPGALIGKKFRALWTRDFDNSGAGDGVHPNEAFNRKYLAPQIMRFIRGIV